MSEEKLIFLCKDIKQKNDLITRLNSDCKIIDYSEFSHIKNIDIFEAYNAENSILCFGMSHLQGMVEQLGGLDKVSVLAAPSMDLYLYRKYLSKIINNTTNNQRKCVRKIVFELPYYIFNYDLSKTKETAYKRFSYFYNVNDYHNLIKDDKFTYEIKRIDLVEKIFGKDEIKFSEESEKKSFMWLRKIHGKLDIINGKYSIWEKNHVETINENCRIFADMIEDIKKYFDAEITLIVMPFNPLFIKTHRKIIKQKKEQFYGIIKKFELTIQDDFNYFSDSRLFVDHCHLNYQGAYTYKKHIDNKKLFM